MEPQNSNYPSGQGRTSEEHLKALGICLGASTVSLVEVMQPRTGTSSGLQPPGAGVRILHHVIHPHEGNPRETLIRGLKSLRLDEFDRIAVTGRRFRKSVNLSSISEPEAVEYAYRFIKPPLVSCPAVVSAGGETFMVYTMNASGKISNVTTGNKCASGTGEFLLQQLRRMNVTLEEAAQWAAVEKPYHVSGRCSVFCKSDCTHATNKGIPKSKVTAGLCKMMASKILELLNKIEKRAIMLTGGTSQNRMMVEYLHREIPGLIVPEQAPYFEALGAALWALENETADFPGMDALFAANIVPFDFLPPLKDSEHLVEFKAIQRKTATAGDVCILGLDVGSTTTKAVLLRLHDHAILASAYLRTNGDPVGASRQCYRSVFQQVARVADPAQIPVIGLGVCGSGRQIAGLHALTDGIVNEIIAHAAAAVFFDPRVDTLFEIGGQDAKYTYITNGVPSDYAMNEACSAGTGSFLEESAYETLGVEMKEIAGIALKGRRPPNFNDQCAAFIASDIKNAIHEGVPREDVVAGLVYSICMNYKNRVKGNRPVGRKVFMQGGVCYNRAIPLAMAALVGKPIVVPPEPGLMGAFGVALEIEKRIEAGFLEKKRFHLGVLAERSATYGKSFVCKGGGDGCDRRCEIAVMELEGKKYPFGGACNRYYNLRKKTPIDASYFDLVRLRDRFVFHEYGPEPETVLKKKGPRIGFNRSFMIHLLYPFYATFFKEMGFHPVLPDLPSHEGIDMREASFCYPAELAHGFFYSLLTMEDPPEFVFLPHIKSIPVESGLPRSQLCPIVQAEPFYLQSVFQKKIEALKKKGTKFLTPLLDFSNGWKSGEKTLVESVAAVGIKRRQAREAFEKAILQQKRCMERMQQIGQQTIERIESEPDQSAIVLFARPYNGFAEEAHMGIPHKLASRGVLVIPFDFLPTDGERSKRHMYWGMGQLIMRAARIVQRHPQLFGTFITNFSCGPDSFLIGYFRDLMGRKPSLTLELDSHTADTGIETRIEAFLDIVSAYRHLQQDRLIPSKKRHFVSARTRLTGGTVDVVTSSGERMPLTDPRVTLLFPSMGRLSTEALAAVFYGEGFHAKAHPPADESVLKLGRANTSCKECLPLILTTGTLINYIQNGRRADEVLVYFIATGSGPCRFGQYYVYMEDLVKRLEIPNVALLSLTSENSYAGMGNRVYQKGWWAIVIGDIFEDIRSMLLANAVEVETALDLFEGQWRMILTALKRGDRSLLEKQLEDTAERLGRIPMKQPPNTVPTILLTGEIFVRRDSLSRRDLTEFLAEKGFATLCSPVAEWLYYSDYLVDNNLADYKMTLAEEIRFVLKKRLMSKIERRFKRLMSRSGLVNPELLDITTIIQNAGPYISKNLTGEAVLTIGSSLTEVAIRACGVIAIGPFGCMPNRISEAILNQAMNSHHLNRASVSRDPRPGRPFDPVDDLPFLAIESDGSPFPQLISAKIETFLLRARRLHDNMLKSCNSGRHVRRTG